MMEHWPLTKRESAEARASRISGCGPAPSPGSVSNAGSSKTGPVELPLSVRWKNCSGSSKDEARRSSSTSTRDGLRSSVTARAATSALAGLVNPANSSAGEPCRSASMASSKAGRRFKWPKSSVTAGKSISESPGVKGSAGAYGSSLGCWLWSIPVPRVWKRRVHPPLLPRRARQFRSRPNRSP